MLTAVLACLLVSASSVAALEAGASQRGRGAGARQQTVEPHRLPPELHSGAHLREATRLQTNGSSPPRPPLRSPRSPPQPAPARSPSPPAPRAPQLWHQQRSSMRRRRRLALSAASHPPLTPAHLMSGCEACDKCYASDCCGPNTGCAFGKLSPPAHAGPYPDEFFGFCCDGGGIACPRTYTRCGKPGPLGFARGTLSDCRNKTGTGRQDGARDEAHDAARAQGGAGGGAEDDAAGTVAPAAGGAGCNCSRARTNGVGYLITDP